MGVERVLLVRHGQTDWNVEGRWQGFAQTSLNDMGREQAQRLADYLRDADIGTIISSDLNRALETAAPLAAIRALETQPDQRWRELNLGIFQGMTRPEIVAKYPDQLDKWQRDYQGYTIPNGESRKDLQNRAYEGLEVIAQTVTTRQVAVVTHGGTIKQLLLRLFSDMVESHDIHIFNTSITTLERRNGAWMLVEMASTPHLPSM